jgi:hypothetical protein
MHRFAHRHHAAGDQAAHFGIKFIDTGDKLVGIDKAFHADTGWDGADQIFHLLRSTIIVHVDHAAYGKAGKVIGGGKGCVQMVPADIVEIDIDAGFAQRL